MNTLVTNVVTASIFAILGIALFALGFWVFDRLTPGSLWKELIEDQNQAIGTLMAGVAIGIAIIIAAAVV